MLVSPSYRCQPNYYYKNADCESCPEQTKDTKTNRDVNTNGNECTDVDGKNKGYR